MKRVIALVLTIALCFGLFACSNAQPTDDGTNPGNSGTIGTTATTSNSGNTATTNTTVPQTQPSVAEFDLYQAWQSILTGASITFREDGTAVLEDDTVYNFEYNENQKRISLDLSDFGIKYEIEILEENGTYTLAYDGSTVFVLPDYFDVYHSEKVEEQMRDLPDCESLVTTGERFLSVNGVYITINRVEIVDSTNATIDLHVTCENTTSEDTELADWFNTCIMRGGAIMAVAMMSRQGISAEDLMIPANTTKDMVLTVVLYENLDNLAATVGQHIVFIAIGIPCGEADEGGKYKYNFIDVAPFYAD